MLFGEAVCAVVALRSGVRGRAGRRRNRSGLRRWRGVWRGRRPRSRWCRGRCFCGRGSRALRSRRGFRLRRLAGVADRRLGVALRGAGIVFRFLDPCRHAAVARAGAAVRLSSAIGAIGALGGGVFRLGRCGRADGRDRQRQYRGHAPSKSQSSSLPAHHQCPPLLFGRIDHAKDLISAYLVAEYVNQRPGSDPGGSETGVRPRSFPTRHGPGASARD